MVTLDRLQELLCYDPLTGVFTWRKPSAHRISVGDVAGCVDGFGYIVIRIDNTLYRAHRLAWLYVHEVWPEDEVDHIDRNRTNNALRNLREATKKQNAENSKIRVDNTSGYRGVTKRKDCARWVAQIRHNGETIYLGIFKTPEEASEAYESARHALFTHVVNEIELLEAA